jgi:hypothetical protein
MSQINVDIIVNKTANGAPILSTGCTVGDGYVVAAASGARVDGTLTAGSFVGDGSGLFNTPAIDEALVYALKQVLVFEGYERT